MFTVAKSVAFAFLAASMASAAPPQHNFLAACEYFLTPNIFVAPGSINTVTEFNFVIGTSLSSLLPSGTVTENENSTSVQGGNNTFTVHDSIGVVGKTAKQTAAILTQLTGTTHNGFANGGTIEWTFDLVTCKV